MSSYQNSLSATPNGLPGATSPNSTLSNVNAILNNGPTSSPIIMASTSSPISSRPLQSQPEQIIVPVGNVISAGKISDANCLTPRQPATPSQASASSSSGQTPSGSDSRGVLDKMRLRDLVKEVDSLEQMDDDVEDVLLQVADDFIENVVAASCQLAKHRRSNTLEAKDVQLYLERCWNMQIPGFGAEEFRPYKKSVTTEAHKQFQFCEIFLKIGLYFSAHCTGKSYSYKHCAIRTAIVILANLRDELKQQTPQCWRSYLQINYFYSLEKTVKAAKTAILNRLALIRKTLKKY